MHAPLTALLLLLVAAVADAIFADQAGEADFHLRLIGRPSPGLALAHEDAFVVATDRGLLACLDARTGALRWRQEVHLDRALDRLALAEGLVLALSHGARLLQAWDARSGLLAWETALPAPRSELSAPAATDLSFDPASRTVSVLAHHSLLFLHLSGSLLWQFAPDPVYKSSALNMSKGARQAASSELSLVLSQLTHPGGSQASTSTEEWAAVGCFVDAANLAGNCAYSAVVRVNHGARSASLSAYAGLSAPALELRSNLPSHAAPGPLHVFFALDPLTPALLLAHLAPGPGAAEVLSIALPAPAAAPELFSLAADRGDAAYAGTHMCDASGCSSFVYFPRPDEPDSALLSVVACPGPSAIGLARDPLHPRLARAVTCSRPLHGALLSATNAVGADRVVSAHTQSTPLPPGASVLDVSSLSALLAPGRLALLLTCRSGLLLIASEAECAVREEALAYTKQAVLVPAPPEQLHTHALPSLSQRLAMQAALLSAFAEQAVSALTLAAHILAHTPPTTVFRKLWHGDYRSERAGDQGFGFARLAVCLTSADALRSLRLVVADLGAGGAVRGAFVPSLPEGDPLVFAALLPRDEDEEQLWLLAGTEGGRVLIWTLSVAALVGRGVPDDPAPALSLQAGRLSGVVALGERSAGLHTYALLLEGARVAPFPQLSLAASRRALSGLFFQSLPPLASGGLVETRVADTDSCAESSGLVSCASTPVAAALLGAETLLAAAYPVRADVVLERTNTLGDHSLLLKYLNPSALLLVTQGADASGSKALVVSIVDGASAKVLYRASQPYGEGPVSAVVIENHFLVSYWNAKAQRTELSSVALYEGMVGKYDLGPLSSGNSFSGEGPFSGFTSLAPLSLQKTFVVPRAVSLLHRTITKAGLSNKNVLLGTASGQIVSVDLRTVHPRRPLGEPSKTEKEEGLLQYSPYLLFAPAAMVSQNESVLGLAGIECGPSNLESTSLIFAYGLDVFFNHHKPSQSFDLLATDFNKTFLVLLLTGLFVAVLSLQRMTKRKQIGAMWT